MTIIEELEQRLEVMEKVAKAYGIFKEEVEQLQKVLSELKESKKEGKWKPKCNEEYWHRATDGEYVRWKRTVGVGVDDWRVHYIPVFKTEKECRRYWHFMDTVKEKSYEFSKEEWEDDDLKKYAIYFNYNQKRWNVCCQWANRSFGEVFFKIKEDAQYIIDNFKEELMEYFVER